MSTVYPALFPSDSWDRVQPPCDPEFDKKIDGWKLAVGVNMSVNACLSLLARPD